ncbi:MAG: flagellar biosynthesis protein FlhB [Epulopiscium sp. Nuni2H_MBin001]|nr:MAG: flagellar biosynthesis protein FlhB [Epulopiscium sp. Nuni2H_MBin001]
MIALDLQYFASAASEGRTESATSKKREKAREQGQVAKSQELNTAVLLVSYFALMQVFAERYFISCLDNFRNIFAQIPMIVRDFKLTQFLHVVADALVAVLLINGLVFLMLFILALAVSILQTGWFFTFKPMAPKFSKMNPLQGLKKIVSPNSLFELGKAILKVAFLGAIYLNTILGEIPYFFTFYDMSLEQVMIYVASIVGRVGLTVGGAYLFIAAADYAYQKYKHEDSLKMTKQDVKDEHKQSEGDPQIKGKIRQKMREMSMRRMMQAVPEADVIITNPTHYAIAIHYDREQGIAPVVVAKGVNLMAERIKEIARDNGVHIIENKPLARTLYYTVDIDNAIPPELYQAVAEILALVYQLEGTVG